MKETYFTDVENWLPFPINMKTPVSQIGTWILIYSNKVQVECVTLQEPLSVN